MNRYIPSFISSKYREGISSGRFTASTLFLDISGFTPMTEKLSKMGKEGSEVLSNIINQIFIPSVDIIYKNQGFISSFAGDSFTAIFPGKTVHPCLCVKSALCLQEHLKDNSDITTRLGKFYMTAKTGISHGNVEWGILGRRSKTYYFKGKAIDGCCDAEQKCLPEQIVMDACLYKKVRQWITADKISDGFYMLHQLFYKESQGQIINENIKASRRFIPRIMLNKRPLNELREIVNIFILFKNLEKERKALDQFITCILESTELHGGYYNRISFGDKGNTILINFGMPVSYENNLERAMEFIAGIKEIYNNDIKAGITSGYQFSGIIGNRKRAAYDVLGDAVNISARFSQRADWGEIRVSKKIAEGMKDKYLFSSAGLHRYKGKSSALEAFMLIKRKEKNLPVYNTGLYDREGELQRIRARIKPVSEGSFAGIINIMGAPGTGKSRLVLEACSPCRDQIQLCCLQCDDILRKPWNPFIYFLRSYFRQSGPEDDSARNRNFESVFKNLVKNLGKKRDTVTREVKKEIKRTKSLIKAILSLDTRESLYENLDQRQRYENTVYALKEIFKGLCLIKPLIMLIDDIQWIDGESRAVIENIMVNIEDFPLLFIFCARLNDDGSMPYGLVRGPSPGEDIVLSGLSSSGIKSLIKDILGREPEEDLADYISRVTGNNPFYAEQFCIFLRDNNYIKMKNNKYTIQVEGEGIPNQINQIIISRIDRLPNELRELTKIVSVNGRDFSPDIVKSVVFKLKSLMVKKDSPCRLYFDYSSVNKAVSDISRHLKDGESQNLWSLTETGDYHFMSEMIARSAYDMQLRDRLRLLHKMTACSIRELYEGDRAFDEKFIDLSYHFEKAGMLEDAVDFTEKAADFCRLTYSNKKAVELYRKLILFPLEKPRKISAQIHLAWVLELTGRIKEAEKIFEKTLSQSERLSLNDLVIESRYGLGRVYQLQGRYDEAMEHYTAKKQYSRNNGDTAGFTAALGNIGHLYAVRGEYDMALKVYLQKKSICRKAGYKEGMASALRSLGYVYQKKGMLDKARINFQNSAELSRQTGNKKEYGMSIGNLGNLYLQQRNYEKALECYNQYGAICSETGDRQGRSLATGNIGNIYFYREDYKQAKTCYETLRRISRETGDIKAYISAIGNIGSIYSIRGNFKKAMNCYEEQIKLAENIGDEKRIAMAMDNIGFLYSSRGDFQKELEYREKKYQLFAKIGDRIETAHSLASIANAWLNLGNYDRAEEYFDMAIKSYSEMNLNSSLFDVLISRSGLSLLQSDKKEAERFLKKASAIADKLGDSTMQSRVRAQNLKIG